jgi:hypothetical protein
VLTCLHVTSYIQIILPGHKARLMHVTINVARASSYHLGDFTEVSGDSAGNGGDYYVRGVPKRANGQKRLHETHDKQGTNPRQLAYLCCASRSAEWSPYLIVLGQRFSRKDCGPRPGDIIYKDYRVPVPVLRCRRFHSFKLTFEITWYRVQVPGTR